MAAKNSITNKVLGAMSIFSGVQVVGIACSVIRAKLISLWIGPVGVGLFAIFNSVLDMMATGTQLNIRQSAVRDISASSHTRLPFVAGMVRWWCRRLGIIGALLIILLSPVLSLISFANTDYWWAFALLSIAVYALALTNGELALMQGAGHLSKLAKATMIGALTGTGVSVPLYYLLGVGSIIPSILIFAIAGCLAAHLMQDIKGHKNTIHENFKAGKAMLSLGLYLTISSVVTTIASYVFISFLNQSQSSAVTGYYQAGYTLVIQYTGIIFTALSMEYFPRLSRIAHSRKMASVVVSHEILLLIYVVTPLLIVFVAADQLAILILYTDEFLAALPFITIGIGAMVFRALSWAMAFVIISRGDGRMYVITEISSAAIGLVLNITMFNHFGFVGLGISYILWYAIYTLIVGSVLHLRYGMRLSYHTYVICFASILMVAMSIVLKGFGWWASLLMLLPSAVISLYGYRRLR